MFSISLASPTQLIPANCWLMSIIPLPYMLPIRETCCCPPITAIALTNRVVTIPSQPPSHLPPSHRSRPPIRRPHQSRCHPSITVTLPSQPHSHRPPIAAITLPSQTTSPIALPPSYRRRHPPIEEMTSPIAPPPSQIAPAMEFLGDEEEYCMNPTPPSNRLNIDLFPEVNSSLGQGRGICSPGSTGMAGFDLNSCRCFLHR
jgi:hypothetical protein